MTDKYLYPAILKYEDKQILVSFPDFPDCNTYGNDLDEAYKNAKEVLEGMIYFMEEDNEEIPSPTSIFEIKTKDDEALIFIDIWMIPIRDKMKNKAIKKTLTIPKWLNDIAEQNNINFSQLLQSSLKEYLGL